MTLSERLESKMARCPMSGCWIWFGAGDNNGYGRIRLNGRTLLSHRVSWEMYKGPIIPKSLFVLHSCDNPACVNPYHLFLGNNSDNMKDSVRKGRLTRFKAWGELSPTAKLNNKQIVDIRNDTRLQRIIADDYKVHITTIQRIKYGKTWAHLKT